MFANYIIRRITNDSNDIKSEKVRVKVGYISGIVGIIINSLLFAVKLFVGMISGSVAIMADSFNNLSDASSCIITIIGFKLSSMPADKEHPFGHGRLEYISALIVAFMVMVVGLQFVKTSFERIFNPSEITFEMIPFILLLISILFKVFLAMFNGSLGKKIESSALKASAFDSIGDVITTSVVALSFLASKFTKIPIDGYIGLIVSLIILYSSFSLIKETLNPLIGEAPDEKLVAGINEGVMAFDHIIGVHDLMIHNYGPGKIMASIHAEVPANLDLITVHEVIDDAEKKLSSKFNIILVIHMDPVSLDNKEINETRAELEKIIKYNPLIESMHDFRMVGKGEHKNLIFDVVVYNDKVKKISSEKEIIDQLTEAIKDIHPSYNCVITIDKKYA
ncbi:MAG: cation diffusion facilitator family transporter [Inconstantimicrobium porci]|uniref:Cation transporter n=1 Tax=Inconstantimicrobium porci TaxID=2652291 RepID=A0A7X2MZ04_9CLOT|nr:cation diffusion facilitator family transporter [Inconstantimicrobium porci]MDD6770043.1 cation diffusion facilitator family transporter [Inconstantimicrobium porci]MDY5913493.1 cation diffusion facilitator family transporter [Inconstantimicrobium porci]MSR91699.1 cation transporter [Inconstantimicrobium porci]